MRDEKKQAFNSSLIPHTSSLFYVYCLSDEVTLRMIEEVAGVAGAGRPRLVEYEGIGVVVSQFEGESVAVTRDNVFAHERVIAHVLAHTTPLPFRFGTVTSAARLESYVNSQRRFLQEQLARVRGSVEMSVKLIWDVEAVRREATAKREERAGALHPQPEEALGRGTAFLKGLRREIMGDEVLKAQAAEVAGWLAERLGDAVRETELSVRPPEALFIAAAHMVERVRLEEYQERLHRARLERPGLHFLTSGPWPPYSFSQNSS